MGEVDLSLVDLESLTDELLRRFDHAVFIGMREVDSDHSATFRRFRGERHMVAGLAFDMSHAAVCAYHEECSPGCGIQDDESG